MSKAALKLGGGTWATKNGSLLGYANGSFSDRYVPREFTFSRGTDLTATRVNADGLIEKGRENILLQSNSFDVATNWLNQLGTGGTITSGFEGYDGTNDAWKITKAATTYRSVRQIKSSSGVQTFSAYLKADTLTSAAFRIDASSTIFVDFDLTYGTYNISAGSTIDVSINEISNGWYRAQIAFNSSITNVHIMPDRLGTTAGSIYIQDAQLEKGLVATDYIETGAVPASAGVLENEPRIDYSSGTPSLLLESQRTNIITQSEYFGGWTAQASAISSVIDNHAISPQGVKNASKINFIPQGDSDLALTKNHSVTGGATYTYSIYIKGDGSNIGKDIVIKSKRSSGDSAGTTTIQTLTGDWKRINFSTTYAANNTLANFYISSNDATSVLVYGAQVEEGTHVTSYIPTYGDTSTRTADSTNDLDTSSLLNQFNDNTFFGEIVNYRNIFNTRFIASYDAARDNGDRILIYTGNGSSDYTLHCQYKVLGETTVQFNLATGINYGDTVKFAVVFKGTQMIGYVNGQQTATATIVDADNFNRFDITDVPNENGVHRELILFSEALTHDECIELTTL